MTSSMTAFAHIEESDKRGTFTWEIRTVNQRYLEVHFRLPESTRALEPLLREKIKAVLYRGKVECTLHFRNYNNSTELNINQPLLSQLQKVMSKLSEDFPALQKASIADLLLWPGIIETTINFSEESYPAILQAFDKALCQIKATRNREGGKLQAFILHRVSAIQSSVVELRRCTSDIIKVQHQKIKEHCQQLMVNIDSARLEQELVLLMQKADITEELDRLETHTKEVERVLGTKEAIGRRLDFLMQELNREANTIASKSISAITAQVAVNIKVMIEQAREQIQNIE